MFTLSGRENRIFLISSHNSAILGATCTMRHGRYHIGRVEEITDIADIRCGSCWILMHSPQTSIIQDYFPGHRPEVLEMMLDDRIREEGFFGADASFSHTFTVTASSGKKKQILAVSMPSHMVETAFDIAEETNVRRLRSVTPVPAALAALMGSVTEEPVMAVVMRNSSCEFLVCHHGLPLMMQASPVEHDAPDVSDRLFESMKMVAGRMKKTHNMDLRKVLFLGHGVDYSSMITHGFHVMKPDISRLVSAEEPADLSRYPEFVGVLLSGHGLNYVPQSWYWSYRIQDVAFYAGLAAGLAALFMSFLSVDMHREVVAYRTLYMKQRQKVSQASVQVLGMLPESSEKAGFEKLMGYWKQNRQEPRMDETLIKIARALAPGTDIDHFKSCRKDTSSADASSSSPLPVPAASAPPPAAMGVEPAVSGQAGPDDTATGTPMMYEMDLITTGDFRDARARFEHSIENLRKWFVITDITWKYDQNSSQGTMKCRFKIRHQQEAA